MPDEIGIIALPDVPEEVRRLQWAVWLDTVTRIGNAGGFSLEGLEYVRRQLRPGGIWPADRVPASHRTQHAAILDGITGALVQVQPDLVDYYRGAGDLLPAAPDDLSGVESGAS